MRRDLRTPHWCSLHCKSKCTSQLQHSLCSCLAAQNVIPHRCETAAAEHKGTTAHHHSVDAAAHTHSSVSMISSQGH